MKWTTEQQEELRTLCFAEFTNAQLAEHFKCPVTEIHAKRSQLGITIPKVLAAKGKPAITVNPDFEAAVRDAEGLEHFTNGIMRCLVLARQGDTALICIYNHTMTPFVVPMIHRRGETEWDHGRYFGDLATAWAYYLEAIKQ